MKQTLLKILGCFMLGGILASMVIGGLKYYKYQEHERMVEIVKSPEGQKAIKRSVFHDWDKKDSPNYKFIKAYKVNYKSIRNNPMAGIEVELYINDCKKYQLEGTLVENEDGYQFLIGRASRELSDKIDGK